MQCLGQAPLAEHRRTSPTVLVLQARGAASWHGAPLAWDQPSAKVQQGSGTGTPSTWYCLSWSRSTPHGVAHYQLSCTRYRCPLYRCTAVPWHSAMALAKAPRAGGARTQYKVALVLSAMEHGEADPTWGSPPAHMALSTRLPCTECSLPHVVATLIRISGLHLYGIAIQVHSSSLLVELLIAQPLVVRARAPLA